MILIHPPEDPDLDGAASTYAYSEFLKKQDLRATGAAFGDMSEEAEEVFEELGETVPDATYYLYSADEIIIVSASSMEDISSSIEAEDVSEVVDHVSDAMEDFPDDVEASIDEDVSTSSAIIAEKFRKNETEISREAAKILHAAVNSPEELTEKDREISDWLEERIG